MQTHSPAIAAPSGSPAPRCPLCNRKLVRTRRHLSDRLISIVTPVQRYCCIDFGCHWEGRVRVGVSAATERDNARLKSGPRPLA